MPAVAPSKVVECIQSNQSILIHGAAATPHRLIEALTARAESLCDVEILHLHTCGEAPYADPKYRPNFRVTNFFVGENLRRRMDYDRIDYLPCFLSEIPALIRSRRKRIDVALIHVSPPDAQGYCSLGTSVDIVRAAVDTADVILAQINPQMPRVHGDGFIHLRDIDQYCEIDAPLPTLPRTPLGAVERAIGEKVAGLIEEGSTLQVGIGDIPDATLSFLRGHRKLGIHTEMWSDGVLDLIQDGVVDNSLKKIHPGKTVSGFVMGTKKLYDFIHDNPSVVQLDIGYINNPTTIARNPKVVAINSAVEIDLTGQVCADSVGNRIISGIGGQMDFMRGAALSSGGKPILALPSRAKNGAPKIVSNLRPGAGVVTTRGHIHHVVTEYGVADLYGKTLHERAKALIALAHPDDREDLARSWKERASIS